MLLIVAAEVLAVLVWARPVAFQFFLRILAVRRAATAAASAAAKEAAKAAEVLNRIDALDITEPLVECLVSRALFCRGTGNNMQGPHAEKRTCCLVALTTTSSETANSCTLLVQGSHQCAGQSEVQTGITPSIVCTLATISHRPLRSCGIIDHNVPTTTNSMFCVGVA
jgi:hypothetical protein